jgi:glycosyltransferase involved in cell wall biosynthesis
LLGLLRRAVRATGAGGRPDVVHGFWAGVSGLVAVLAGRRHRVASIVSAAGGELVALRDIGYGGALGRGGRLIAWTALRLANRVTVSSGWMAEHVRAAGHRVDDVIALGVDTAVMSADDAAVPDPARLVHVASRNLVKDPFLLLDAFALVRSEVPSARLEMIGVDTLGGAVEQHAERLGLSDAIEAPGFVRPAELAPHFRRAALHVVSSRHDAAPVAVLEAAACGRVTVGTRVGHVTDLAALDPPAAVVVPIGDAQALADAIVGLLRDDERREALARQAHAWAVAHDADWTAGRFEEIYRELVAARAARSRRRPAASSGELPRCST